ncbi:uncharacterized protein LOC111615124 [Centruroides sculpturatus]|uniref:uncharacterized protein LOC111615124 n=1 Tax=Centruroides sculpturatus TaxID=218467 RepID=UPI000C6DF760|nr:uncharacterized protein LOC111615124 [Centruroides sculpturatus]
MRFFFILFTIEVLIVRNYCFLPLSRIKRNNEKDNENMKNDTYNKQHISIFTDPKTGKNPYVDITEAEPTDNFRNIDMLNTPQNNQYLLNQGNPREMNASVNQNIWTNEILVERGRLLKNEYRLDTESKNSSSFKENVTHSTMYLRNKEETDTDVFTPTSFSYVNVTTSLVNSLSSPSIETYLITATSIIFLMAAIIIVFGVWKWRWLGRQHRRNNEKTTVHHNPT